MAQYGYNEVLPGLFIGSRFMIYPTYLNKSKITHLLSVDNFQDFPPGFITKTLNIDDEESENILQYFNECIEFIGENRTLVFCTAGRSRSATIVAAYLMKIKKMSAEQALETIKKVRVIRPNPGFLIQLNTWEKMNCELCVLEKKTEWIEEHKDFVCLICEQCDNPMVVYRHHTNIASNSTKTQMKEVLTAAANKYIKSDWYIDTLQRTIPTHLHWHARPNLFKL